MDQLDMDHLDPEIIWAVLYWRMLKGLSKNTGISIQGLLDHVSAVEEWERKWIS